MLAVAAFGAAADASADRAAGFLRQLVENSAHAVRDDPQLCLAAPPSPGSELAAILLHVGADEIDARLTAGCEAGEGAEFCTLSVSTTAGEDQTSAGFTFLADPLSGRIDLASLRCFQTP